MGITTKEYQRLTEQEVKGRKAKTVRAIKTRHATIPAGTIVTITRKFEGYGIESAPCKCCGSTFYAFKVECQALEFIETLTL